jgi:hypothetical protein
MQELFCVWFSEHLTPEERRTFRSNLEAKGLIISDEPSDCLKVVVFREAKIAGVKTALGYWERAGHLTWSAEPCGEQSI